MSEKMEFKMPDVGEGVAEGEILKWMVKVGDKVNEDQPLVEIMTDKVNVQIPSPRSGLVSKILVQEGEIAKVGQTIVVISEEGEKAEPAQQPTKQVVQEPSVAKTNVAAETTQSVSPTGTVLATPATRKLARELAVDLNTVKGSGPLGRVTEQDVRAAVQSTEAMTKPATKLEPTSDERIPLRGVRRTIAERMSKAVHTAAHVTHVDEADMTELVLLREAFKGSAEKRGVKLTYLPFIIKAVIPALREYPYANSSLDDQSQEIVLKRHYNIGIATDTEQGLVVTVVKNADRKDIFELAAEVDKLAEKARTGQLSLEDVHEGTFAITNVGGIGGLFATPIIHYPQAAILGMHKIMKRPVVRNEKVMVRDMMYLSLSFDHRIFDGAYAARFMNRITETLQDPKKLLAEIL